MNIATYISFVAVCFMLLDGEGFKIFVVLCCQDMQAREVLGSVKFRISLWKGESDPAFAILKIAFVKYNITVLLNIKR